VGISIIYILFALPVLLLMISLAIDIGRIRVTRGEVQTGADAGALGAAMTFPKLDLIGGWDFLDCDQTALDLAAANPITVDNNPAIIQPTTDIEYGVWSVTTRTFTSLGTGGSAGTATDPRQRSNAVRVTSYRHSVRGNPLPLTVARIQLFGSNNQYRNLQATATAMIDEHGLPSPGIVGLTSISSAGNHVTIDSYLPSLGLYEQQTPRHNAEVGSNGDINLINTDVYGNVRPGYPNHICTQGPNSIVTGWIQPLTAPLSFPPVSVPAGTPNLPQSGNPVTVGPGRYQINNWNLNRTYNFTGPVTIYVTGNLKLQGGAQLFGLNHLPANLQINLTASASIDMHGDCALWAHVYAPGAAVAVSGNGNKLYGWLISQKISKLNGTADIHYDETRGDPDTHFFKVVLVK